MGCGQSVDASNRRRKRTGTGGGNSYVATEGTSVSDTGAKPLPTEEETRRKAENARAEYVRECEAHDEVRLKRLEEMKSLRAVDTYSDAAASPRSVRSGVRASSPTSGKRLTAADLAMLSSSGAASIRNGGRPGSAKSAKFNQSVGGRESSCDPRGLSRSTMSIFDLINSDDDDNDDAADDGDGHDGPLNNGLEFTKPSSRSRKQSGGIRLDRPVDADTSGVQLALATEFEDVCTPRRRYRAPGSTSDHGNLESPRDGGLMHSRSHSSSFSSCSGLSMHSRSSSFRRLRADKSALESIRDKLTRHRGVRQFLASCAISGWQEGDDSIGVPRGHDNRGRQLSRGPVPGMAVALSPANHSALIPLKMGTLPTLPTPPTSLKSKPTRRNHHSGGGSNDEVDWV